MWYTVDQKPEDNETVFVKNDKLIVLPLKCRYNAENDIFITIETIPAVIVDSTHWCKIPKLKGEEKGETRSE